MKAIRFVDFEDTEQSEVVGEDACPHCEGVGHAVASTPERDLAITVYRFACEDCGCEWVAS